VETDENLRFGLVVFSSDYDVDSLASTYGRFRHINNFGLSRARVYPKKKLFEEAI